MSTALLGRLRRLEKTAPCREGGDDPIRVRQCIIEVVVAPGRPPPQLPARAPSGLPPPYCTLCGRRRTVLVVEWERGGWYDSDGTFHPPP